MGTLSMKVVLTFQMHRYIVSIAILKLLNQDYQIFVFAINDEIVIQSVPKVLFIPRRRRPSEVLYRVGQIVFHRQLEVNDYQSFSNRKLNFVQIDI